MSQKFSLSGATWQTSKSVACGAEWHGGDHCRLSHQASHRRSACLTSGANQLNRRSLTTRTLLHPILWSRLWRFCDSPTSDSTMCRLGKKGTTQLAGQLKEHGGQVD